MLSSTTYKHLLCLDTLSLGTKSSRCGLVAAEDRLEDRLHERSEDNLSTVELRKGHPEDQDELEHVVEGCRVSVRLLDSACKWIQNIRNQYTALTIDSMTVKKA